MIVPAWINPKQWVALTPPADVLMSGAPITPQALLSVPKSLCVTTAARYAPTQYTFCNIFVSDACQILGAPLPHKADLGDGKGLRELRANDMHDELLKRKAWPRWSLLGTVASSGAAQKLANTGHRVIASWRNPIDSASGHVMLVVPSPVPSPVPTLAAVPEVYVAGAGRRCFERARLSQGFGSKAAQVLFFHHV